MSLTLIWQSYRQLSDKDVVLLTDNASNIITAAQIATFPDVKCFAHTVNLASQSALKGAMFCRLLGRKGNINILPLQHHSEPLSESETAISWPE